MVIGALLVKEMVTAIISPSLVMGVTAGNVVIVLERIDKGLQG